MNDEKLLTNVATGLSVVQLMNTALALFAAAKDAVANGKTHATTEDVKASLAKFDGSIATLDASIDRAESEGR